MKAVRNIRGFTLLEVMVVIVILGILASMVVPNLLGSQERANIQKAVSDINALETSLTMYKMDNYQYPTTEQSLEALVTETDIEPAARRFPQGGYVKRLPNDPWGNEYQLLNPGEHSAMDVFSMGPDGEPGTDDDIGNWNLGDYQ
ncbi:type II secretion system major pseudopilin GspG [Colwellia sp. MB3u-70]|uniref:type II secretion system major pseudopilin GspG n=1 Tax=unclassified Colwellia TaxID=196834 RepID=UPI0015F6B726|nr:MULTISPECIES: type II secretion system major pseudopilin GspG [unclassified Colwellia]MBA6293044.1 type II secretion system major pseudopilin GspG [Colwellia sp. MB3u-8]MBA6306635.1 type II secretion system major pseudopilin GspG [Colwellia sp. MB3u-70]MBA6327789.1 type II secretion system major pseudopilin GspG [Colwellia sp. MB02u-6]